MTIEKRSTVEFQGRRHGLIESCRLEVCVQDQNKNKIDDRCMYCNQYIKTLVNKENSEWYKDVISTKNWLDYYEVIENDPPIDIDN